ncbi:spore germination protein [Paenibacillus mucilaginosus 3016]|uniref:Spore germination protein n=1 Tax=Paenibacillus mucilaginosus 3016 TaxID=1116391 RepID=H6NLX2_9BACL|nr:endospore germination permease [Paenibacillus mucilaginosus]AFC31687.1 spore germination protein [Paenibacillus mucilaginosus 3016]WFA20217.1 spore gernimation protein [Paenibacillus mucilaginosus]
MEKLSERQLILIGIAYILNTTLISVPNLVLGLARMDAWFSYGAAVLFFLPVLWMLARISRRFPGQDLFSVMIDSMPAAGRFLAAVFIFFYLFVLMRDLRMLIDFVNIILLPLTPLTVTASLLVITVIMIARGGMEILGRMTELWLPVLLIVIVLIPVFLFQDFDLRFIRPFFDRGLIPPLQGAYIVAPYIGEIIALPLICPGPVFRFRTGLTAMLTGMTALLLLTLYTILTLGTLIPDRVLFPTYEMVRQIRATDFLDRFDLPLVGIYLPTMITKVAYSLFVVCHGLHRMFPGLSARKLINPFGLAAYVGSFWLFDNTTQMLGFNRFWPVVALPVEVLLPVLLFLMLRRTKRSIRGGDGKEPGKERREEALGSSEYR